MQHKEPFWIHSLKFFGFIFSLSKYKNLFIFVLLNESQKHGSSLLEVTANDGLVCYSLWNLHSIVTNHIDKKRWAESLDCQFLDEFWDCCREYHRVVTFCQEPLYGINVFLKAHVKHLVSFIKDLVFDVVKVDHPWVEHVDQSSWSRNNDLWSFPFKLFHWKSKDGNTHTRCTLIDLLHTSTLISSLWTSWFAPGPIVLIP